MGSRLQSDAKAPDNTFLTTVAKLIGVLVGACFGAITLSGVVKVVYSVLEPGAMRQDGQSILAFILSVPIGMILGGAGGYKWMSHRTQTRSRYVLSSAGALSTMLVLGLGLFSASSRGLSVPEFLRTVASPWCLGPLIASLAVLITSLSSAKHA